MSTRPLLVIQHEDDAGLDLMAGPLTAGFGPDGIRVVRPDLGQFQPEPGDLGAFSGLVVLGGAMAAWEDDVAPWLPATRSLLVAAVRQELPTLGICLGSQLLALACGGTVERGGAGLEIGATWVRTVPGAGLDPFVRALDVGERWPAVQYHYDAVDRLPDDAELLVTGDVYRHQGFRVGPAAWGFQYHPEVSIHGFTSWVEDGRARGSLPADAGPILRPVREGAAALSMLSRAHARAFLELMDLPADEAAG